ncbi:MAG: TIGR00730 family Rossman fold protein [Ignavibacteriales bacterium]|nr:TIGR00730 family Rossman fold protein [Ignavibacteriales bacterium]
MKLNNKPPKAYKDLDFLNSPDARTVRILSEFYEPQARFRDNKIADTIVFFGSSRIVSRAEALKKMANISKNKYSNHDSPNKKIREAQKSLELSKYYEDAVELSKRLTNWSMNLKTDQKRFIICSGGGPGIMEAANKGAKLAGGDSIGLNISIPTEQYINKYVKRNLAFEFHYFFMRKFWFIYLAKALIAFPGGFGTMDELMEVLTLIQTKKVRKKICILVYDKKYWNEIINFDALLSNGMISANDKKLIEFCNDVDEAFNKITEHFKKYYL